MLSCNATVGNPPVDLHWCVRRVNNKEFIRYTGLSIQQEATFVGPCQYTRTSDVYINGTSEDGHSIFMCEAGNDWICDGGYINEVFELFAVDLALTTEVTSTVSSGDTMNITCYQSASGLGILRNIGITLYRNTSDAISATDEPVVSLTFNSTTNISTILWYDDTVEDRATIDGDVMDPESAYLSLVINNVTCLDGGFYRFEMTGVTPTDDWHTRGNTTQIHIDVKPDDMDSIHGVVDGRHVTGRTSLSVGTSLMLSCNATVGNPPVDLHWCVRRVNNKEFIRYTGCSIQQEATFVGPCQYTRTSDVYINVTSEDAHTIFMCEAGNDWTCDGGYINEVFELFAVDLALTTDVTSTVSSGETINITCYQSASGLGKLSNIGITLYRNTSDAISATNEPVFSLTFNSTTNISTILWYDDTVEGRATIDGDVMDPESAYLSLVINNATCLDGGFYWFEMTGVTPTDDWHTRGNTTQIHIDVKPGDMELIHGVMDGRHVTGRTSLSVGTSLMLSCNATVGNPPVDLHWCVRRVNNTEFIRYTGWSIQQEATFVGPCQYTRTSDVYINVTSEDAHTIFMCEAGNDWICDGGYINEVFELLAVSADLTMDATTYVTSGQDSLSIVCMLSGEILGDIQDLIFILSRAPISGNITALQMIVSVTYNSSTNQSDITWFDLSTQHRASVHGSVVDMVTAYINLTIDKAEVTCSDSGLYSCELVGVSPTYERFMWREEARVEVYVKPVSISDVIAQTDNGLYSKEGVFSVGTGATLFCNSTVGDPPLGLHWCVRKEGQFPVVYEGFSNDTGPNPIGECQFTRSSSLLYTIKSEDTQTDFICVVGSNGTCGLGHLSSAFTLYAAVISVNAESTPLATSGLDNITVTCSVSGLRLLYDWMFSIYHNTSRDTEEEIIIISLLHAGKTNSTDVIWREPELQTRADYSIVLTDIDTMKLELSFQGEFVTCIDSGLYRCEISGNTSSGGTEKQDNTTSVTVIVLPDKIEEVNGKGDAIQANSGGIFTVNSSLVLTCNSSLGNPPMNMHWCTKMYNESHWIPYPNTSHINQTYSLSDSCNYWSISTLTSEVKDTDISTLYRCEVGDNSTCGQSVLNSTFSVYGVDVDMVIQGTKSVIGGIDDLQITCSQNATGIGLIENTSMVIYHQPQGSQWYLLVTLTNNISSGNDVITWHNTGVDELWSANGSLAPLVTSYLQLTLKHANCRNGGAYECVLQGQVGVYGFTKKDRLDVEVQALPDRIEPIEGQLDEFVLAVEGRFPVSRTVSITCNSTVGNPPLNLFWRFKRVNDTDYTFINGSDLLELAGTGSCQLRRISQLLWTVTSADEKTVFNCIVGPTPNSAYLNATFTIIAIPCNGDCSKPEPSTPSDGVTSAVIVASVVAPLLLLLLLIGLFGFWKFPGFRTLLFKRKYFGPKVKPQDFGRDTALDLNGVGTSAPPTGTSAPPTGTSLVNGSVK
ncbi:uncharacterized protein [Argopecten irradians]|uniref:uncharacterized protein n=1 Tax=Argopecten irradians TaxID=31199 RepID=UPI00371AB21F